MRISDWSSDVCSSDLVDLTRIGLGFFKEFLDVFYRQLRGIHHDDLRRLSQQGNGREVFLDIVVQLLVDGRRHRMVSAAHKEGIAVCRSASRHAGTQRTAGAAPIRSEEHTSELQSLM